MSAYYWIKLYHEIIDDPKMATLPDRLWRRIVELFLLAGRHGKDGALPETRQLAWELRMITDELELDLKQIASTGIIQKTPTGWFIPNYAKRQSPSTSTERVHQHRERQKKQQYYVDETQLKRNVTQITDIDTETDVDAKAATAEIFRVYEQEIGAITPAIADKIEAAVSDYPVDWFVSAFQESARQNKRNWAYANAILKRWKTDGFQVDKRNKNGSSPDYNAEMERAQRALYPEQFERS